MCLTIKKNFMSRVINARKKGKKIIAYKELGKSRNWDSWVSPYQDYLYKNGINTSTRNNPNLDGREKRTNNIFSGLHCFASLRAARLHNSIGLFNDSFFFKVEIDPKDIVAFGKFDEYPSVVCTKLKIDLTKSIVIERYIGYEEIEKIKKLIKRSGK